MTPKEIIDYNRRSAEFLELELSGPGFPSGYFYKENYYHFDDLKFHSDWNWIMKVVEAIEKIHDEFHGYFGVHIISNSCTIQGTNLRTNPENYHPAYYNEVVDETKDKAVTKAINQFLIWYENNFKN